MRREVWIVSNFPPPVHGVSAFNVALIEGFDRLRIPYRVFQIGTRGAFADVEQLRLRKLVDDPAVIARLAAAAAGRTARERRHETVIYLTPSQLGAAIARDAAIAGLARAFGIPLIGHIHGCRWLDRWAAGGWQGRLMFEALRTAERVICLGPTYAARMREATGFPCVGINNGVPAPRDPVEDRPASPELELLFLSNLIRRKGLWVAARALRELRSRGRSARLRCAGAWPTDQERDAFTTEFKPELSTGSIELVGFVQGQPKEELYRRARFFLLPIEDSLEGQPLTIVEAMARGTVPITTHSGGIPDLLDTPELARLATDAHRDPRGIADTIEHLLADRQALERLSMACRARHHDALSIHTCVDRIADVVQRAT